MKKARAEDGAKGWETHSNTCSEFASGGAAVPGFEPPTTPGAQAFIGQGEECSVDEFEWKHELLGHAFLAKRQMAGFSKNLELCNLKI